MPTQTNEDAPQQTRLLMFVVIAFGAWMFFSTPGGDKDPPDVKPPDNAKVEQPTESMFWDQLAVCVEKQVFGVLQQDTDHLIKIADMAKSAGHIQSTSRVDQWRSANIVITDANRAEIAGRIRSE